MQYKFLGFSFIFSTILLLPFTMLAQQKLILPESTWVSLLPAYDSVGKVHRKIFGENYRMEYAYKTKLPIIQLSRINGGLVATQRGGGNQSKALRLP